MPHQNTRLVVREVNAAIVELEDRFGRNGHVSVLCECGAIGCLERLEVPTNVFDEIRITTKRFLVAPGHVGPGGDDLVDETPAYRVVETDSEPRAAVVSSSVPAQPQGGTAAGR